MTEQGGSYGRNGGGGRAAEAMSDEELVSLVLDRDEPVQAIARLSDSLFSRLSGRMLTPVTAEELAAACQLPPESALRLAAAIELARRLIRADDGIGPIRSPRDACREVARIRGEEKEHFVALYLNSRNVVIHQETISVGSLNANIVHPREVFRPAIARAAAAVVLAHNHPSGEVAPSNEDMKLTARMVEAGRIIGIEVLDHIIVGAGGYMSFRSESYL